MIGETWRRAHLTMTQSGCSKWEGDETDDGGHTDQQRIADLEPEQNGEAASRDQGSKPVADGDFPEEHTGTEDRADGGGIGPFNEALNIRSEEHTSELQSHS